jgi:hypothetical protein
MALAQMLVIKPVFGQYARAEVLNHHVGTADQLRYQPGTLGPFDVDADAALAAVEGDKAGGDARLERGVIASQIASGRKLDLDHLRPQVGHHSRRQGTGYVMAQLNDSHAGKRRLLVCLAHAIFFSPRCLLLSLLRTKQTIVKPSLPLRAPALTTYPANEGERKSYFITRARAAAGSIAQGVSLPDISPGRARRACSLRGRKRVFGDNADGFPNLTGINGVGLASTSTDQGFATDNVETHVAPGTMVTLTAVAGFRAGIDAPLRVTNHIDVCLSSASSEKSAKKQR